MKFLDSHPQLPLLVSRCCDLVNVRAEKLSEAQLASPSHLPWIDRASLELLEDDSFCREYPAGFVCDLYPDELAAEIDARIFARVLHHGWFFRRTESPGRPRHGSQRLLCLCDAESGTKNPFDLHLRAIEAFAKSLRLSVEVQPFAFIDNASLAPNAPATSCLLLSDSQTEIDRGNLFAVHHRMDVALLTSARRGTTRAGAWGWTVIRPPDVKTPGGSTVRAFAQETVSWLRRTADAATTSWHAADPLRLYWLTAIFRAKGILNDEQTRYKVARVWAGIPNRSTFPTEDLATIGSLLEDAGPTRELQVLQLFRAIPAGEIAALFQTYPPKHLSVRALIIAYLHAKAQNETEIACSITDALQRLSATYRSVREQYQRFVALKALEPSDRSISDLAQGYLEVSAWSGVGCILDQANDCWTVMVDAVHQLRHGDLSRPAPNLAMDENSVEWVCDQTLWPWGYLMSAIKRDRESNGCHTALKRFLGENACASASSKRLQLRLSACERNDAGWEIRRIEPDQVERGEAARIVLYLTLSGRKNEAAELWSWTENRETWADDPLAAPETGVVHLWYSQAGRATQVARTATDPTHGNTLRPTPGQLLNLWLVAVTLRIPELERATAHVLRLCEPQFLSLDCLRDSVPTIELPEGADLRSRWREWAP